MKREKQPRAFPRERRANPALAARRSDLLALAAAAFGLPLPLA
jgi:hypothetical protein